MEQLILDARRTKGSAQPVWVCQREEHPDLIPSLSLRVDEGKALDVTAWIHKGFPAVSHRILLEELPAPALDVWRKHWEVVGMEINSVWSLPRLSPGASPV